MFGFNIYLYIEIKNLILLLKNNEGMTHVNIYAPSIEVVNYTMQTLIELLGDIDSSTTIVTEFDNPLTTMDTSSRQKINRNHWF